MEFNHAPSDGPDFAKFTEYLAKQFGKDMKSTLEARDELAKRQGALSAVDATLKAKMAAEEHLQTVKDSCDKLTAETKDLNDKAKKTTAAVVAREKAIEAREKAAEVALENGKKVLDARDKQLVTERAQLNEKSAALDVAAKNLAEAEAALAARVKVFQEKVAKLTA